MAHSISVPTGFSVVWHEEVDSTNKRALEQAAKGGAPNHWVCAHRQTAGRGSHGRAWRTLEGNLAASLYLQIEVPLAIVQHIPLLAGLAALSALEPFAADGMNASETSAFDISDLCLKWPNDILIKNHKLGGILVESRPVPGIADLRDVVIGFGVNIVAAPKTDGLFPAGYLHQFGCKVSREQVFSALAFALRDWLAIWRGGKGFDEIRLTWMERACHMGRQVEMEEGGKKIRGRFAGLDGQGSLILEREGSRTHHLTSGHLLALDPADDA